LKNELRISAQLSPGPGLGEDYKRVDLGIDNISIQIAPVPEPSSIMLLAMAVTSLNLRRRRQLA
jgi:PEP-CTERM motif